MTTTTLMQSGTGITANGYQCIARYWVMRDVFDYLAHIDASSYPVSQKRIRKTKVTYYDIPASYDIETTTYNQYIGWMYAWMININGYTILGRTWDEFDHLIDSLIDKLDLSYNKRLVVYVHNLPYEFQFIRKRFAWSEVFTTGPRKVLYAVASCGIEFRCSLKLTNLPLKSLELHKYKTTTDTGEEVVKQVGDLDYSKIRHSDTPLSPAEIKYCIYDVITVSAYIQEQIEQEGHITDIPYTSTGYVRRKLRMACLGDGSYDLSPKGKRHELYRKLMGVLRIRDAAEYELYRECYTGGSTAVNPARAFETWLRVHSYDIASSYPAVIVMYRFPMSAPKSIDFTRYTDFIKYVQNPNMLLAFRVAFVNFREREETWTDGVTGNNAVGTYEHPLSASKCRKCRNLHKENGRVVSADYFETSMTNVDWQTMEERYEWDAAKISDCIMWHADYLPYDIVDTVLSLYWDKTKLKGIAGKEIYYNAAKALINAIYGCCGTDPVRDPQDWDMESGDWMSPEKMSRLIEEPNRVEDELEKYNRKRNRFLYPWWAVFITAYARRRLQRMIGECKGDYVYSDTDSVKVLGDHSKDIASANAEVDTLMTAAMQYHGFPLDRWKPWTTDYTDSKGKHHPSVCKPLGYWDDEGEYVRFKALRSKCYMTESVTDTGTKIGITVAGASKKLGSEYMASLNSPFDLFNESLSIPADYSGRLTHRHIDHEIGGSVQDYLGNVGYYHEWSAVTLMPAEYNLSGVDDFLDYCIYSQYVIDMMP